MDRSNKEAYLNLLAIYFKREERVGVYMDFLRKMQRGDSDSSTGTIDWIDTENKILNGKQLDSDLLYGKAIELYEDWILDEEEDLQDRKEQMLRYVADRDILKFFELIYELGNEMTSSVSDVSGRNGEVFLHWLLAVQPVEFLRLLAYSQAEEGSSDGISGAWDRADMATVINMYDELHNNGSADWVIDRWVDDSVSGPVFVRDFLNDVMQRQVWRHKDLNSFDEVICDIDVQGDVFFGKYSGESDAWPYYTNEGESDFGDCVVPSKNALVTVPLSMVSAHYTAW
ncbi:MAG: hypothetical protein U9Q15_01655, partial [Patescibacteria group bacterium]|nr:hypothetical protein [Patescibacteria group bacterium]